MDRLRHSAGPGRHPDLHRVGSSIPPTRFSTAKGNAEGGAVRATYSDAGTDRDVTHLALFPPNNETSAAISPEGVVTAEPGARRSSWPASRPFTVGSQYIVLPKGLQYQEQPFEPANYVDQFVSAKLKKLRIHPSGQCTDEEFIRRIYIDLVGVLLDEGRVRRVHERRRREQAGPRRSRSCSAAKSSRSRGSPTWAEILTMRSSNEVSVQVDRPVLPVAERPDRQQRAAGQDGPEPPLVERGTFKVPQTNFYQIERDRLKLAENVAQMFMGMRIQCASATTIRSTVGLRTTTTTSLPFFSQVGRKAGEDSREQIIFNAGGGEVPHPVTGKNAVPHFLGGGKAEIKPGEDRRVILAKWLASPQNPYFAKNFANRVWQHFFGIGIVEEIDDVRISNPESNPELLEAMAKKLTETNYDFKGLVRDICNSKTYQRSTQRNESNLTDERNSAHQTIRRIKAESMLDIISQVTNTKDKFRGLPRGARAVQIADGATSDYFLTTFGRATRETACSCEVKMEPTLSQALHLMNGDLVNAEDAAGGSSSRSSTRS